MSAVEASRNRRRRGRSAFFATLFLTGVLLPGLVLGLGGCGTPGQVGQEGNFAGSSPSNSAESPAPAAQSTPRSGNGGEEGEACPQILERMMKEYELRNEVDDLVHRLFEAMARGDLGTAHTLVAPGVEVSQGKIAFQDAQGRKLEYTFPKEECLRLRGYRFSPDLSRGELSYENRRSKEAFAEIYVTVVWVGDGYRVSEILQ